MAFDFYKTQYYCIYDMETDDSELYSLAESESIYLTMSEIKKMEIQAIITPNLRPMAAKILFENEIEVYKAAGAEVKVYLNERRVKTVAEAASLAEDFVLLAKQDVDAR